MDIFENSALHPQAIYAGNQLNAMCSTSWVTGIYSGKSSLLLWLSKPSGHRSVPEWILWSAWQTRPPRSQCVVSQGSCLQTATKRIESGLQAEKTSACSEYVCELYLNAKHHKESMTFQGELDPSYPVSFAKSLSLVSFVLTSDYARI